MIPVSVEVGVAMGCNPRPFIIAIAFAASLSFATPIGYQTNLMVLGPGGYRPSDYLRVGLPLALIITTSAIILIPQAFPF
jgi:di/tricarboxylate transporter